MTTILSQQKLLLELLVMSGDIAVADDIEGTILDRTLRECQGKGWVVTKVYGAGFLRTSITSAGRAQVKKVS